MGLFDKFKKSDKNNDVNVNGWDAITNLAFRADTQDLQTALCSRTAPHRICTGDCFSGRGAAAMRSGPSAGKTVSSANPVRRCPTAKSRLQILRVRPESHRRGPVLPSYLPLRQNAALRFRGAPCRRNFLRGGRTV